MTKLLIAATLILGAVALYGKGGMPQVHGTPAGGKIFSGGSVVNSVASGVGSAARRLRN